MKRALLVAGLVLAWLVTGAFGPPPPPTPRASHVYVTATSSGDPDTTSCDFPVGIKTSGYGILHTITYQNGP